MLGEGSARRQTDNEILCRSPIAAFLFLVHDNLSVSSDTKDREVAILMKTFNVNVNVLTRCYLILEKACLAIN